MGINYSTENSELSISSNCHQLLVVLDSRLISISRLLSSSLRTAISPHSNISKGSYQAFSFLARCIRCDEQVTTIGIPHSEYIMSILSSVSALSDLSFQYLLILHYQILKRRLTMLLQVHQYSSVPCAYILDDEL